MEVWIVKVPWKADMFCLQEIYEKVAEKTGKKIAFSILRLMELEEVIAKAEDKWGEGEYILAFTDEGEYEWPTEEEIRRAIEERKVIDFSDYPCKEHYGIMITGKEAVRDE